jgi:hypothetical protein
MNISFGAVRSFKDKKIFYPYVQIGEEKFICTKVPFTEEDLAFKMAQAVYLQAMNRLNRGLFEADFKGLQHLKKQKPIAWG